MAGAGRAAAPRDWRPRSRSDSDRTALGRRTAALYFESGVKGRSHLFRIDLAAKRCAQVTTGERTVRGVDVNEKTGAADLSRQRSDAPRRPLRRRTDGSDEQQLTHLECGAVETARARAVERVPFKGADGWDVDGFLVKPVGWQRGKKYPLILSIHGGPAGQYGVDWYPRIPGLCRARLGRVLHESARLDRLRREVRARNPDRMGRQGVHRHHERCRCGARGESVDRHENASA